MNEYNNTYHNTYIDFSKDVNDKDRKFQVGDHVRISKRKFLEQTIDSQVCASSLQL